jgi:hypothetical protein
VYITLPDKPDLRARAIKVNRNNNNLPASFKNRLVFRQVFEKDELFDNEIIVNELIMNEAKPSPSRIKLANVSKEDFRRGISNLFPLKTCPNESPSRNEPCALKEIRNSGAQETQANHHFSQTLCTKLGRQFQNAKYMNCSKTRNLGQNADPKSREMGGAEIININKLKQEQASEPKRSGLHYVVYDRIRRTVVMKK